MNVAIAVIVDSAQRVLLTQRPWHVPHGGFWEFPGGKIEPDESSEAALIREVDEEVGLKVEHPEILGQIHHVYPDKEVTLIIFRVTQFKGKPRCLEGQLAMKWIHQNELDPREFPEANREVIAMIHGDLY